MHEWESGRTKKSYVDGCVETLQFCLSHAAIDPSNADDRSRNAQRSDFNPPVMVKRARRDERKEKKSCAACGETSPTTFELAPDIAAQNIRLSWMSRRAVVSPPQLFLEDDIHMNAMPCAAMQWVWPAKFYPSATDFVALYLLVGYQHTLMQTFVTLVLYRFLFILFNLERRVTGTAGEKEE
ncbi:hypothetical protein B0J11DRAFT_510186 [Dendryphion nanum]|uniref:Uncharacterized protein n=1 Tax=Dendryphion nanum TaxID=256645 RepID=A0A9P9DB92_9PLEO|nr:hypothetical protein B0J11DRAFT_510186 [Dendryphion nanum]